MAHDDPLDEELAHRRTGEGEHRWPPAMAVLVAAATYALLPQTLVVGPRFAIPAVELVLLGALVGANPWRMVRRTRWSRWAAVALAGVVIVTNLVSLGLLVARLSSTGRARRRAAGGCVAGLADERDRVRPAGLGDRPRWTGRSARGAPRPAERAGPALSSPSEPFPLGGRDQRGPATPSPALHTIALVQQGFLAGHDADVQRPLPHPANQVRPGRSACASSDTRYILNDEELSDRRST